MRSTARRWNIVHDVILFYSRTDDYVWNGVVLPHSDEYVARYKRVDADGRPWTDDNLTAFADAHSSVSFFRSV